MFQLGFPILGICYGHQIIIDNFGGKIKKTIGREYGRADLVIDDKSDLFSSMDNKIKCWISHGDTAEKLPEGFKILAHTRNSSSVCHWKPEKEILRNSISSRSSSYTERN